MTQPTSKQNDSVKASSLPMITVAAITTAMRAGATAGHISVNAVSEFVTLVNNNIGYAQLFTTMLLEIVKACGSAVVEFCKNFAKDQTISALFYALYPVDAYHTYGEAQPLCNIVYRLTHDQPEPEPQPQQSDSSSSDDTTSVDTTEGQKIVVQVKQPENLKNSGLDKLYLTASNQVSKFYEALSSDLITDSTIKDQIGSGAASMTPEIALGMSVGIAAGITLKLRKLDPKEVKLLASYKYASHVIDTHRNTSIVAKFDFEIRHEAIVQLIGLGCAAIVLTEALRNAKFSKEDYVSLSKRGDHLLSEVSKDVTFVKNLSLSEYTYPTGSNASFEEVFGIFFTQLFLDNRFQG